MKSKLDSPSQADMTKYTVKNDQINQLNYYAHVGDFAHWQNNFSLILKSVKQKLAAVNFSALQLYRTFTGSDP